MYQSVTPCCVGTVPTLDSRPYLKVVLGSDAGCIYPLVEHPMLIGRAMGCDILLRDYRVSRRHARVEPVPELPGAYRVVNLGGRNGTIVNGTGVEQSKVIRKGDRLFLGGSTCLMLVFMTREEAEHARLLHRSATRDHLTRAFNRSYFLDRLGAEWSFLARHGGSMALALLDADRLGSINEEYGHPAGDLALAALASTFRSCIRPEDTLARYDGATFALLLPGTDLEGAHSAGERLRSVQAESAVVVDDHISVVVTISLGMAVASQASETGGPRVLLNEAGRQLFSAKRHGGDYLCVGVL